MTIQTLAYIHKLLIAQEKELSGFYRSARRRQRETEEFEQCPADYVARLTEDADRLLHEHLAAADALADFEAQEF